MKDSTQIPHFVLIGLSDCAEPDFSVQLLTIIACGKVFSGGKRHRDIVSHLLPPTALWIDITVPLSDVFSRYYGHDEIIVFASGDPLFYGFGGTIRRQMPEAMISVYPHFNSLQLLAHRLSIPYEDMQPVSLTGRPWKELDVALIERRTKIGLLTDRTHTPASIARRLIDYGFENYRMAIGELLGNRDAEHVSWYDLDAAARYDAAMPNAVLLYANESRPRPLGIPEEDFMLLDGRVKMITKSPIRLATLSALNVRSARCLWDVGFCTGSVSIEAKLQVPHLDVVAFEIREMGELLIRENCKLFGVPGIDYRIGDFLTQDLRGIPQPDIVFVGGHGGKLAQFVSKIARCISSDGRIGFNAVSKDSYEAFLSASQAEGLRLVKDQFITVDNHNPIHIVVVAR